MLFLKVSCFQQVEIFVNRTAGNIPAEILPHGVLGHLPDFVRVAVEGFKGFLQRFGIGVDIVFQALGRQIGAVNAALFGKEDFGSKTVNAVFNGINQPAGGHGYRQRAFGHGFHLRQAAGFKAAGHQVKVGCQLDGIGKFVFVAAENKQPFGRIGVNFGNLVFQFGKQFKIVGVAGTAENENGKFFLKLLNLVQRLIMACAAMS